MLAALLVTVPAFADPSISSKRAEADAVLAQISELDAGLEHAVERYNAANVQLDRIRGKQRQNRFELEIARHNLGESRQVIAKRLVSLYTADDTSSALEVILGAKSLDDVVSQMDTADRVSALDTQVLGEVRTFKAAVKRHERELADAKAAQEKLVAQRAAERRAIEGKLAERRRLLSSIRSEIARLEAAERARQARLAREAQARLEAQQRALAAAQQQQAQQSQEQPQEQSQAQPAPAPTDSGGSVEAPGAAPPVIGATAETPEGATVAPPPTHGGVVGVAMQYLGIPYRWGGGDPSGFDCSGFTSYVYAQVGVSLPHYTGAQWSMGVAVSRDELAPGDLVFFNGLGHVGLYIGGGQFVHSPHTGDVVKISSLSEGWYASTYMGARRIV
jgi:cell wall-associated NlpC family hydrolase